MLIIAGKAYVEPEERDRYVELHKDLIRRSRSPPDAGMRRSRPIRSSRAG